ncbi:MAG: hypothetical protein IJE97_06245 [Thermoguttaceae bacterium]|nr:hypothetical protein [Thermoguttaceae bacterium]
MAKLSGFFMSTLLIVLCLWINVCHYPDALRLATTPALRNEVLPVDETLFPSADAPRSTPPSARANDDETDANDETTRQSGLVADAEIVPAPRLLDVSASQTTNDDANANVASPRRDALKPAAFPDEGAEIDDAPGLGFDATPDDDAPLAPASFDGAAAPAPSSATFPASETASSDLAPSEQDARRSATKPRGAKYVRVPEVEIDAYSGGVRAVDASRNETRVVGATRARQTLRVPAPAP